jgi:pyrroline-5-carboxylate reductase
MAIHLAPNDNADPMSRLPVLMAGAGAMGGALIAGWRRAGSDVADSLMIRDPKPGPDALAAVEAGAILDPSDAEIARARTVIFAVKPQIWRTVAAELAPKIGGQTVVVSVAAGIGANDIRAAFGGRPTARVMPTLAAAIGQGSFSLFAEDATLADEVASLFECLGAVVRLTREDEMHAATAASGSGPAYLYAFIEALEAAAVDAGLPSGDAARMVRATVCGAAALLAQSTDDPAELRRRVTSPGGTTEAALKVLMPGLDPLLREAVAAATARSRELGG